MSADKIISMRFLCVCELPDCPGKGKPWTSKDDRIPDRCNWCGRRTWNGQDKRRNLFITAHGKVQRLFEWSRETGLSVQVIHHRLKIGWTEEDAVTIPVEKRK